MKTTQRLLRLLGLLTLAVVVYSFPIRRWFSRWGTTPEEWARAMPGDALNPNSGEMSMQAVTVNAPPEDIWPWLVQIGSQRGGLYSYDWLDRLFGFLDRPSATRILPEFQQLAVGDKMLLGRTYPLDDRRTRLVTRGTERVPKKLDWWLGMRIMEPAAFIMTRRMLLDVKQRAETLRASAP